MTDGGRGSGRPPLASHGFQKEGQVIRWLGEGEMLDPAGILPLADETEAVSEQQF